MKRLIGVLLLIAFAMPLAYANMGDALAVGQDSSGNYLFRVRSDGGITNSGANVFSGAVAVTGLQTATGGITIPSGAAFTIAAGAIVNSTAAVFMDITGANGLNVTNHVFASSYTATTGNYGYISDVGNTEYSVVVATTLASGGKYFLTLADGKIGDFDVKVGTTGVRGVFTAAAVVSLTTDSSASVSTTVNTTTSINVFDGGSVVGVQNCSLSNLVAHIKYTFIK